MSTPVLDYLDKEHSMSLSTERMREPMKRWARGEDTALDEVFTIAYATLCKRAQHLLKGRREPDPRTLVHDAFMKLGDVPRKDDPEYFHALMAKKMRWLLKDWFRADARLKRGGGAMDISLSQFDEAGFEEARHG